MTMLTIMSAGIGGLSAKNAIAQSDSPDSQQAEDQTTDEAESLNLTPEDLENSPVLRRWREGIPNVQQDIQTKPAFPTRLRVGYVYFPSGEDESGVLVGVEDVFIGRSHASVSATYSTTFNEDSSDVGGSLQYYLLPLGSYVNVAPVVGYRSIETEHHDSDGLNLGIRLVLALSRGGASDLAFTQTWVEPGQNDEISISSLSFGYALTEELRLGTDVQLYTSSQGEESRFGILLEWLPHQ